MAKIKHKASDNKKFAKEIIKYWKGTYNREKLKEELTKLVDKADTKDAGGVETDRQVEVDFVFDTELDPTHRLVWIAIPAPDPRRGESVAPVRVYRYYDSKSLSEKQALEEEIGKSALFGCGR